MAGRHEGHGARTTQVSVVELIDRIAGEGKPFRLAEWSNVWYQRLLLPVIGQLVNSRA